MKLKKSYQDSWSKRHLSSINLELQDVQKIMVTNIEEVLQRGETLSALDSKASNLSTLSKKYRHDAKLLNSRSAYAKAAATSLVFVAVTGIAKKNSSNPRLQCLRARFLRGKVAPLAPTESGREDAAAVPPTLVVAAYLGGKKGPNQELAFLRAVRRVCEACKGKGLRTLPFSKQAVGEEILDIMEEAFFNLTEPFVEAMATVQKLSQFQPPLGPDLRSSIVAWAVRLIVSGSPGPHQPHQLELQDRAEKGLREMLEQLLREDPSAGHVVGLLEIRDSAALGNLLVQLAVS
uniref:Uncharacterized protein n=1 Tax=Sphaerodactylus townsendi TaxID=933632 RepID=A0ACB8FTB3_9SAUR